MTATDRPLGLRYHLRSAAASCEGRARFHRNDPDGDLFNALADLFYEQAEIDEHDTAIGRHLLAVADILNRMGDA